MNWFCVYLGVILMGATLLVLEASGVEKEIGELAQNINAEHLCEQHRPGARHRVDRGRSTERDSHRGSRSRSGSRSGRSTSRSKSRSSSRGSSRSTSSRSGSSRSRSASRSASSRSRSQRSDSRSGSADSHRHSGHKHKASSSRNKSHRALTSAERKAVLDAHNKYRSKLARGRARNRGGKRLPKAANMVKLRYNVELEKYAEAWAKRCWFEHSSGYEHARDEEARYRDSGGYGENLAIMGHEDRKVDALKRASVIWWDELEECGIDSDTLVYISARKQKCLLGHWTQMAWATSTEMGCAVAHCDSIREKKKDDFGSGDHIVCHYTPSGNWIDKTVYKSGPTCSECPNGSHCDRKSGLCVY